MKMSARAVAYSTAFQATMYIVLIERAWPVGPPV